MPPIQAVERRLSTEEVTEMARLCGWVGPRRVRLRASRASLAFLCRQLADLGFVVWTGDVRERPAGCHLAFLIRSHRECLAVVGGLLGSSCLSARGHLILDARDRTTDRIPLDRRACLVLSAAAIHGVHVLQLDLAEARLRTLHAAARLARSELPGEVRDADAIFSFWTGAFDRVCGLAGGSARPSSELAAIGRVFALWDQATNWRAGPPHGNSLFGGPALRPAGSRTVWDVLADIERRLYRGDHDCALRRLDDEALWREAPPLASLARRWLAACGRGDPGETERVRVWINRCGARGLTRWGWGARSMQWMQALPTLVQQIADADDELGALEIGWRWLMASCDAQAVAWLDVSGATLCGPPSARVAFSDAERRAAIDSATMIATERPDGVCVAVPVRYTGTRIGALVVAGSAERAPSLAAAATSLAAIAAPALRTRLDALAVRRALDTRLPELIGMSPAMGALRESIVRAAASPFPVLIEGESGSGKELVARAIHRLSTRRDRRLAALNCAALTDELAETELFGHTRGAFTGAVGARAGLFEEAHAGTLFLDEVAELSPRTQAKLLRALQEGEVRRVGENAARSVDVRVLAATNRPLREMVAHGRFRDDLLFRLAVIRLRVPPLRDRPEDISLLAQHCWRTVTKGLTTRALLGADALVRLARHHWPGNVRELQNVIAGVAVLAPARGRVTARHVETVIAETADAATVAPVSLDGARADVERRVVSAALARHGGRRAAAARELGLTRQGLAKALKRLRMTAPASSCDAREGVA